MRTRPGRSVTKSRPSGARSTAHGALSPDATSWTFSTTAAPMRGDGVGVGLADAGAGVVGIGIVVVFGEELADGGATHEERTSTKSAIPAARRVARRSESLTSRGCPGDPVTRPRSGRGR